MDSSTFDHVCMDTGTHNLPGLDKANIAPSSVALASFESGS